MGGRLHRANLKFGRPRPPIVYSNRPSALIIRVEGVCAVTANDRHQLTGVQIWAVKGDNFQVEGSRRLKKLF